MASEQIAGRTVCIPVTHPLLIINIYNKSGLYRDEGDRTLSKFSLYR